MYIYIHMGHTATKPDKVNILLCDINERLIIVNGFLREAALSHRDNKAL